ncbi:U4/U6.U5 snRNP associated protein [Coemansia sp. RSA 1813]|nr:U4/U6.U5 snRNP associated protein [Coemansia sp. RSA 1843]KAJ2213276.1 U4/U6.U5 snRNP associated protein [Coemansia sp. RSA 487]KAJ2568142.1 U4/U6.U5 snRNP associated protein [Coemansia sp. RSA 1813]
MPMKISEGFRRNWDNATYEKKAQDREQKTRTEEEDEERRRKGLKPRIRSYEEKSESKELLQAHKHGINLEGMVGKTQVVQASVAASGQPGFYCKVCDVTVKDSMSYLDHINGKNHQRMLNRSMKVAVETVDDVLAKLNDLRKAKQRQKVESADYSFHEQVRIQQKIDQDKRLKRKEARKRHRMARTTSETTDETKSAARGEADDIELVLGISSFGSTKK